MPVYWYVASKPSTVLDIASARPILHRNEIRLEVWKGFQYTVAIIPVFCLLLLKQPVAA